jgi:hypothetical protein
LAPAPATERGQAPSRRATVGHSKYSWEYPLSDHSLQTTAFRQ